MNAGGAGSSGGGAVPLLTSDTLPPEINAIVERARNFWLKNTEVVDLLENFKRYRLKISGEPPAQPTGGLLFLFNRKENRFFRKDGHSWRKKSDGKTVRETHEKLKVGNSEVLNCYYAHADQDNGLQRRCYWLLDEAQEHIVLVHYLNCATSRAAPALGRHSSSAAELQEDTSPTQQQPSRLQRAQRHSNRTAVSNGSPAQENLSRRHSFPSEAPQARGAVNGIGSRRRGTRSHHVRDHDMADMATDGSGQEQEDGVARGQLPKFSSLPSIPSLTPSQYTLPPFPQQHQEPQGGFSFSQQPWQWQRQGVGVGGDDRRSLSPPHHQYAHHHYASAPQLAGHTAHPPHSRALQSLRSFGAEAESQRSLIPQISLGINSQLEGNSLTQFFSDLEQSLDRLQEIQAAGTAAEQPAGSGGGMPGMPGPGTLPFPPHHQPNLRPLASVLTRQASGLTKLLQMWEGGSGSLACVSQQLAGWQQQQQQQQQQQVEEAMGRRASFEATLLHPAWQPELDIQPLNVRAEGKEESAHKAGVAGPQVQPLPPRGSPDPRALFRLLSTAGTQRQGQQAEHDDHHSHPSHEERPTSQEQQQQQQLMHSHAQQQLPLVEQGKEASEEGEVMPQAAGAAPKAAEPSWGASPPPRRAIHRHIRSVGAENFMPDNLPSTISAAQCGLELTFGTDRAGEPEAPEAVTPVMRRALDKQESRVDRSTQHEREQQRADRPPDHPSPPQQQRSSHEGDVHEADEQQQRQGGSGVKPGPLDDQHSLTPLRESLTGGTASPAPKHRRESGVGSEGRLRGRKESDSACGKDRLQARRESESEARAAAATASGRERREGKLLQTRVQRQGSRGPDGSATNAVEIPRSEGQFDDEMERSPRSSHPLVPFPPSQHCHAGSSQQLPPAGAAVHVADSPVGISRDAADGAPCIDDATERQYEEMHIDSAAEKGPPLAVHLANIGGDGFSKQGRSRSVSRGVAGTEAVGAVVVSTAGNSAHAGDAVPCLEQGMPPQLPSDTAADPGPGSLEGVAANAAAVYNTSNGGALASDAQRLLQQLNQLKQQVYQRLLGTSGAAAGCGMLEGPQWGQGQDATGGLQQNGL